LLTSLLRKTCESGESGEGFVASNKELFKESKKMVYWYSIHNHPLGDGADYLTPTDLNAIDEIREKYHKAEVDYMFPNDVKKFKEFLPHIKK
jgi:hypothetical protein